MYSVDYRLFHFQNASLVVIRSKYCSSKLYQIMVLLIYIQTVILSISKVTMFVLDNPNIWHCTYLIEFASKAVFTSNESEILSDFTRK